VSDPSPKISKLHFLYFSSLLYGVWGFSCATYLCDSKDLFKIILLRLGPFLNYIYTKLSKLIRICLNKNLVSDAKIHLHNCGLKLSL
jgi:hypothetical protein